MLQRLEQKQDFEEGKIQACTNLWRTCWWINTYYRSNLYNVDAARPVLRSRTREHPVVRILPGAEHWSRPVVIDDMEHGEFYCQNKTTKEIILKYMYICTFRSYNTIVLTFLKGNKNLLNVSQINSHFQQINFMLHIFCLTVIELFFMILRILVMNILFLYWALLHSRNIPPGKVLPFHKQDIVVLLLRSFDSCACQQGKNHVAPGYVSMIAQYSS